ncbi:hypothetical protein BC834DRAFT_143561 [Gloeopeniophorella convolvens]|nr:hypothetical protein BC834DRAFT_143561 [Gloeopeniophorella convolvens]
MVAWSVYRDQLAHLSHGLALWEPDPGGIYDHVTIGDLGYVDKGHFMLMFNILLRGDHPRQTFGVPESFEPLNMGHFPNECSLVLSKGSYCSQTVSERKLEIGAQGPAVCVAHITSPISAYVEILSSPGMASGGGTAYKCTKKKGAMLSIPFNADRQDAIRTKLFETYIIAHCDSWLPFADKRGFPVDRLEDIIIVTGRDLTNSWAMAAFTDTSRDWDLSLSIEAMGGGANLGWSCTNHTQNSVECHDSGLFSETELGSAENSVFIHSGVPR